LFAIKTTTSGDDAVRKRKKIKIIIEKHKDGYVAYPIGLKGVVVGQGDTYDDALQDIRSAIRFHMETFGSEAIDRDETT
jgi:predicted RNase H-like HicB family nuclease